MENLNESRSEDSAKTKRINHPNSTIEQRKRVKAYLAEHGSASTIEMRHKFDVLMPAARIHELRHKEGCDIETVWVEAKNPGGESHSVARYFLREAGDNGSVET